MHNIAQIDIGELISVKEQRVDGVYRELESMLLTLSRFYLKTDPIRKDSEKLIWFGEKGALIVSIDQFRYIKIQS